MHSFRRPLSRRASFAPRGGLLTVGTAWCKQKVRDGYYITSVGAVASAASRTHRTVALPRRPGREVERVAAVGSRGDQGCVARAGALNGCVRFSPYGPGVMPGGAQSWRWTGWGDGFPNEWTQVLERARARRRGSANTRGGVQKKYDAGLRLTSVGWCARVLLRGPTAGCSIVTMTDAALPVGGAWSCQRHRLGRRSSSGGPGAIRGESSSSGT